MIRPLDDIQRLLPSLTRGEKALVLQSVAGDIGDAFPGIESDPKVCGGAPCIVRTRIPVWLLEHARRLGTSEADLLRSHPALRAEDLANARSFARSHQGEIDEHVRANERDE